MKETRSNQQTLGLVKKTTSVAPKYFQKSVIDFCRNKSIYDATVINTIENDKVKRKTKKYTKVGKVCTI